MIRPRIIIDESVSAVQFAAFETFARQHNLDTSDRVFIKEAHPAIPDSLILQHYLDETTILVTTDRPFHNTVLARGLRSYYLDSTRITDQPLSGIRPNPEIMPAKNDLILKDSYEHVPVDIRPLLLPASPGRLKKLRVKRRRIRNHFQGAEHLEQVAVSVSWLERGTETLIGIRVRIASNVGLKALEASESYLLETIAPKQRGLVSICHALVLLIQLMLHPAKTVLYYDADQMDDPLAAAPEIADRYQPFFETLLECFEQLEFVPVTKGQHLEKLRRKLDQLSRNDKANEIVPGDILEIANKVTNR
jgi:hypothetical protein